MRFPIKGTVFAVIFLLTISFTGYLQPARAENTVTFKMAILPAPKNVLVGMGINTYGNVFPVKENRFQNSQTGFFGNSWDIFNQL